MTGLAGGLILRLAMALLCLGFTCVAAWAYRSEQLVTKALAGRKTVYEYEKLLRDSHETNPYNGQAAMKYAQLLQSGNRFGDSRQVLLESGLRSSQWQGWELEGNAWEWLAFRPNGTMDHAAKAARYYDNVLRVNPSYEKGLERRIVLALKTGDWTTVELLATQLLAYNATNSNVVYFRGRMAEGRGDYQRAYEAYSKLAAGGFSDTSAIYTRSEIAERLESLKAWMDR